MNESWKVPESQVFEKEPFYIIGLESHKNIIRMTARATLQESQFDSNGEEREMVFEKAKYKIIWSGDFLDYHTTIDHSILLASGYDYCGHFWKRSQIIALARQFEQNIYDMYGREFEKPINACIPLPRVLPHTGLITREDAKELMDKHGKGVMIHPLSFTCIEVEPIRK